jgi:hypothetical protein
MNDNAIKPTSTPTHPVQADEPPNGPIESTQSNSKRTNPLIKYPT